MPALTLNYPNNSKRTFNGEWLPMYKPSAFDKPFYEVVKTAPKEYQLIFVRQDTGNYLVTATLKYKPNADHLAKLGNKQLSEGVTAEYQS